MPERGARKEKRLISTIDDASTMPSQDTDGQEQSQVVEAGCVSGFGQRSQRISSSHLLESRTLALAPECGWEGLFKINTLSIETNITGTFILHNDPSPCGEESSEICADTS